MKLYIPYFGNNVYGHTYSDLTQLLKTCNYDPKIQVVEVWFDPNDAKEYETIQDTKSIFYDFLCRECKKEFKISQYDLEIIGAYCKECASKSIHPKLLELTQDYKKENSEEKNG